LIEGRRDSGTLHVCGMREDNYANPITYSDAFAGGFVAGIVQGKSLDECVDMGQWLASLGIRELGPS